jgi:mevalonate kinase
MPAISASAPGKIILFGEHAVVYGRPAIAVPISQIQSKAYVFPEPHMPSGNINIQAPNIGLEANLSDLPHDHPLVSAIQGVLSELDVSRPPAFTLRVTSSIPLAAGMGSGAAVSTAIIRALSTFLGHPLPTKRVSDLVFEVEKIHHGSPSGIDNTVITFEMPVFFIRDDLTGNTIETFSVAQPFTIVIADTGISTPTSTTVGDVRLAWENNPTCYEQLFDDIGKVVLAARTAIENGQIETLGTLMNENHSMLVDIGVSSPELNHLVQTAQTKGAFGAKLSGGGRGGNIIALTDSSTSICLADSLEAAGAVHTLISDIH